MTVRRTLRAIYVLGCACLCVPAIAFGEDLAAPGAVNGIGLQRTWELDLKLPPTEAVSRVSLLDDSLYVLTNVNRVYAVHAPTGIIRWSKLLAEEDKTIRGPSHGSGYVFFTTGGEVMVLNRRTGEPANEPRSINGVVIEVQHDTAIVSVGEAHGVHAGDTLRVYQPNESGDVTPSTPALAELKLTSVQDRKSMGKLTRLEGGATAQLGDRVLGSLELPLEKVKLPFAASCAAVADAKRIYVGAANQRFYSLDILHGTQYWQLMTPNTVASTPLIDRGQLYFAGLDGRIVSCTKDDRVRNWEYLTEGPIFADLVIGGDSVYAASSDRSLYCLDRSSGKRRWRVRFDTPLLQAPVVADDRVYISIPEEGLFALNAKTGEQIWRRREGGQFLVQLDRYSYLYSPGSREVLKVNVNNGSVAQALNTPRSEFTAASQADQAFYLISGGGAIACLRSKDAPRLKPEQVVDVLRNDRRAKTAEEIDAAHRMAKPQGTGPIKSKLPDSFFEEDWLISKSTATPVGGHGLAGQEEMPAKTEGKAKSAAKPAAKKGEEPDEEGTSEGEEGAEEKPAASGSDEDQAEEEEGATSKPSDEMEEGGDDEGSGDKADSGDEGGDDESSGKDDDSDSDGESDGN